MSNLTAPQQRILNEVRLAGSKTYNGRARRSIEALERAGLVSYAYDRFTKQFIVTPLATDDWKPSALPVFDGLVREVFGR